MKNITEHYIGITVHLERSVWLRVGLLCGHGALPCGCPRLRPPHRPLAPTRPDRRIFRRPEPLSLLRERPHQPCRPIGLRRVGERGALCCRLGRPSHRQPSQAHSRLAVRFIGFAPMGAARPVRRVRYNSGRCEPAGHGFGSYCAVCSGRSRLRCNNPLLRESRSASARTWCCSKRFRRARRWRFRACG